MLSGRVPYAGRSFKVGAIADGKIIKSATISRAGGAFTFRMPAGNYQLALLISGLPVAESSLGCATSVALMTGQTRPVNREPS